MRTDSTDLHHVGIVVRSIGASLPFYRDTLGLVAGPILTMTDQAVRVVFMTGGRGKIELLEPLEASSGVGRFLAERGKNTLHHVCYVVEDLAVALNDLAGRGIELIDREPRRGAEGMVAFLHPRAGDGVLIELIDRASIH